MKMTIENGQICNQATMGRDCRDLVRFGLLMRRIALDWSLSRRWREDLGASDFKYR